MINRDIHFFAEFERSLSMFSSTKFVRVEIILVVIYRKVRFIIVLFILNKGSCKN